ncbi:PH domain-containing protein [Actinocorallia longicatena]
MKPLRSTFAAVCAWAWLALAALNLADVAFRGRDKASLVAAAVLLLTSGIAYVLGLRPKAFADAEAVTVVNPLRTTRSPWSSVTKIDGTRTLTVHHEKGETHSWAVQASPRAQRKAERAKPDPRLPEAVAAELAGRTPVTFAIEHLTAQRGPGQGPTTTTWSPLALTTLLAPLTLLIAALFT